MNKDGKQKTKIIKMILLIVSFFMISCASVDKKKQGDIPLRIVVCDENNKGIEDFELIIKGKSLGLQVTGYTNSKGVFVFDQGCIGDYEVTGRKNGFGILDVTVNLSNFGNVFFCKVDSLERIFTQSLEAIEAGDFFKALKVLDKAYFEEGSFIYEVSLIYKAKCFYELKNYENVALLLKELKKSENKEFSLIIEKLENNLLQTQNNFITEGDV